MTRLIALLGLGLLALHPLAHAKHQGACALPYCECTPNRHPDWTIVNCTVPHGQSLDLLEGDLPGSTTDLIITGAEAVMFGANSLSRLKDVRHVLISGAKVILMRKFTALNLNVVSVYLEIDKCDVLRMEERTFSNIKGPLSVTINDCESVSIGESSFSWLLTMSITNAHKVELSAAAFMLDPTAANVGEHGPGMSIELKHMIIPEFAAQTFGSSAAVIIMENVEVHAIRAEAFSANTYNVVMAINSSFHLIEGESFAQKSLINNLQFDNCRIHQFDSKALQSAVASLNITATKFDNVETGAINATVAAVVILDSVFKNFKERGFELSSWNKLQMERNSFDDLPAHAIVAPGTSIHELVFSENEIETAHPNSLEFIGQALVNSAHNVVYKKNYYGQPCHCNVTSWVGKVTGFESEDLYENESYCTVDEFFARCFNVPDQNMLFEKFLDGVCGNKSTIQCEIFKTKKGEATEIKNPRFPHKKEEGGLTARNAKVIAIMIITCIGCVLVALLISLIKWMRRRGYCVHVKNFLISSNSCCRSYCDRLCTCGSCASNSGMDNARSISQLSVNEYSERHRLNEPRVQDIVQETAIPNNNVRTEHVLPVDDKTTQTLPEELTKELLENLKEKLEDPENYVEAREMIEHLYELIKVEESCNTNTPALRGIEENIYELPFQNTTPRIGKNKKQMISVGTRAPSLDKLTPLSPYNRQTALAHEYFEPKDFAVHLYAEIANCEKEKKALLSVMPDIVSDQAVPRGPYLRAVRDKKPSSASSSPSTKSLSSSTCSPQNTSTIKSNKSTSSNSSGKMVNRPLPEKPRLLDPGEGTSFKHG